MIYIAYFVFMATAWSVSVVLGGPLPPFHLKCENILVGLSKDDLQQLDKHHLQGIDTNNPLLSWTVSHTEKAASQSAFQVIVYEDRWLSTVFWKSEKIKNKEKTSLNYLGPTLHTGRTYYWQVLWWDHKGELAVSKETGHFLVAVLDPNKWNDAKWIAAGSEITTAPYLHKTFSINSRHVTNASLFVSGLGFSKPFVNSIDLNARYDPPMAFAPSWTTYEKLVPYVAYEISDLAKKDDRLTVGVMLGRGWRNTKDFTYLDDPSQAIYDTTERVLKVLLVVHYNDSTLTLVTDESWKADETKITFDSIYDGETYGIPGGYQLKRNTSVIVVLGPSGEMFLPKIPYIAEVATEKPSKIYTLYDDRNFPLSQIVDFGSNSAGYCQVFNDNIDKYELRFAEVALHEPFGKKNGSLYFGSNRAAEATDVYLGEKNFTYKPSFTYHGFRYVEVKGFESLKEENIKKIIVHSNLQTNSKFASSLPILNSIQDACIRSQSSNFMSVITDCPQRDERLGWLGDAFVSALSMTLNFDMEAFHYNTLKLIQSDIENGTVPDVVPHYRYGSRPGDPSWSAALIEILYRLVVHDRNIEAGREFYPSALDVIITTVNSIPPEGMKYLPNCHYGDWIPASFLHTNSRQFIASFSFLMNLKQMIEIANILDYKEDSELLQMNLDQLIVDFNKAFMTEEDMYMNGYQEAYVLPLTLGAVPSNSIYDVENNFVNLLDEMGKDIYVTGGIITVRYIFPLLTKLGLYDKALEIAQRTDFPSFGFMIYNNLEPSTTLWELWNVAFGHGNSRNHHMFSSISGWLVTDVAGISLEEGYDEIHFHPARALGISHASVSLKYPKPLHLSWHRSGGVQCAKQAENRSPLNPNLPQNDDLSISCGREDGGVIAEVLFASYGNPEGHCGGYYKLGTCHVPNSLEVVKKLCVGRRTCTIPTGAHFWGNPCYNSSRWLIVSVQCKSESSELEDFLYSSIAVNVSVPMGSRGILHLPTHGKQNMRLLEGNNVVYSESTDLQSSSTMGVLSSVWDSTFTSLLVELDSGDYGFTWKGDNPHRNSLDSRSVFTDDGTHILECTNSTHIITAINWASYGNPEMNSNPQVPYLLGKCHAGSSKFAIEKACIGKSRCSVLASESFFGSMPCFELLEQQHLIVEYSCGFRSAHQKK